MELNSYFYNTGSYNFGLPIPQLHNFRWSSYKIVPRLKVQGWYNSSILFGLHLTHKKQSSH